MISSPHQTPVRIGPASGAADPRQHRSDDRWTAHLADDPAAGIVTVHADGVVARSNPMADRILLGREPGTLAGRRLDSVFPEALMREVEMLAARQRFGSRAAVLRLVWLDRETIVRVVGVESDPGSPALVLQLRWTLLDERDLTDLPDAPEVVTSLVARFDRIGRLTPREIEVLAMVGSGMSIREIAEALFRSEKTVQNHRDAVGTKLGLRNRVELAAMARRAGLNTDDASRTRV